MLAYCRLLRLRKEIDPQPGLFDEIGLLGHEVPTGIEARGAPENVNAMSGPSKSERRTLDGTESEARALRILHAPANTEPAPQLVEHHHACEETQADECAPRSQYAFDLQSYSQLIVTSAVQLLLGEFAGRSTLPVLTS